MTGWGRTHSPPAGGGRAGTGRGCGNAGGSADPPRALAPQPQITEDFRALRKAAEDMNLFKSNHLFFLLLLAHIIAMESLAWFTVFYFGNGWIPTVITAFVLATSQVRRGPAPAPCRPSPSPGARTCTARTPPGTAPVPLPAGPGWLAAARLRPPVRLQEVHVEPHRPQVHHRPPEGKAVARCSPTVRSGGAACRSESSCAAPRSPLRHPPSPAPYLPRATSPAASEH